MTKTINIYKYFIVLLFTFFQLLANAKTLTEELNHAEHLLNNDVKSAIPLLRELHPQMSSASEYQIIRWLFLSMDTAILNFNHGLAKEVLSQSQLLLSSDIANSHEWQQLLETGLYITSNKYNALLSSLERIEQAVTASNNTRLKAYFNRVLHYAYLFKGITDLALDTALQNRNEWLQLEEYYYALEMYYQITELYINMGNIAGAKKTLAAVIDEAKKLNINSISITVVKFESRILAIEGQPAKAYKHLKQLIEDGTVDNRHDQYLGIISNLAFISYEIGDFKETIRNAHIILAAEPEAVAIRVLLAKALIKTGEFNQATELIAQAEKIYLKKNDHLGLFDIDNVKIDLLYQRRDLNELYKSTKRLINRVVNFDDQQGQKRVERAHIVANADEQIKVLDALAESNISHQQKLSVSNEIIVTKNNYLYVSSLLIALFSILVIWLVSLLRKVRLLANTDSLTGINNRRAGLEKAKNILRKNRDKGSKHVIGIAMMDLDRFKTINDTYGHDIGDKVIQATVTTTKALLSKDDIFCRMGGEEFLIIIVADTKQLAIDKLNTLREEIHKYNTDTIGVHQPISASFGLSFTDSSANDKTITDYIIDADTALYEAKESGRNRLVSH
ncbi:MAG: diguanylate cyclase (GGDEF)-like protein [Alteromonadaceae bacterium]|jgi:diguanylate cyclase (GGDEF)-like protein